MQTRANEQTQLNLAQVLAQFIESTRSINEQNARLLSDRAKTSSRNKHLALVTGNKPFSHYLTDCPVDFQERQRWIEKVLQTSKSIEIGIRWVATASVLSCVPEGQQYSTVAQRVPKTFDIDVVVPFSSCLVPVAVGDTSCMLLPDELGDLYLVPIPIAVWDKCNSQVFFNLSHKLPLHVSIFCKQVPEGDGVKLLARLRQQNDNIAQSQIQIFEQRLHEISVTGITDYVTKRGELLVLFEEWDRAVDAGYVEKDDRLSADKERDL